MKKLVRPVPFTWWLRHKRYFMFMVREVSAVFTGCYAIILLLMVRALANGPEAWQHHVDRLNSAGIVKFHVVALVFILYHAYTWFALTPKVMVVQRGEKFVPGILMVLGNYAALIGASVVIAWVVMRGLP